TMTKSNTTSVRKTCHRCVAIRIFFAAVVSVGLLQVFAPQTFQLVKGFSPMTLAALFVGAFGLVAILKSVGDHYSDHSDESNDLE
ncbi:MAG: disulfide bond formation protein DsbB, partial [Ascidiaceihabitans sp.]